MLGAINGSDFVQKSVLLALDEVYDETGCRRLDLTNLYVPNRLIASLAKENRRVLLGASMLSFMQFERMAQKENIYPLSLYSTVWQKRRIK